MFLIPSESHHVNPFETKLIMVFFTPSESQHVNPELSLGFLYDLCMHQARLQQQQWPEDHSPHQANWLPERGAGLAGGPCPHFLSRILLLFGRV